MYYIQPIHLGKLSLFLNSPESKAIGITVKGSIKETALGSWMEDPKSIPRELPTSPIRKVTK